MTPLVAVGLAVAGGLGAAARLLVDGAVSARFAALPLGTLVVNLSGAVALGLLVGAGAGGEVRDVLGTGLLGGYTTFSTWMFESHRLAEDGRSAAAAANVGGSLLLGLAAAAAGRALGGAL